MIYNIKGSKKQAKVIYKGIPVRLSGYFSEETLKAKRDCHNIFKLIKRKKHTTKNILLSNTIIQIWRAD